MAKCNEIYAILKSASLFLRKWISNCPQIVSDFKQSDISNSILDIGEQDSCRTLGVQWLNQSDNLRYTIKQFSVQPSITKRYILSIISQIYDPSGLLSPSIILLKILIQKLWSLRTPWDITVPPEIEKTWLQFQNSLSRLNKVTTPRNAFPKGNILTDIHCFCDASKNAYATCIYLRSVHSSGEYSVQLLCAKTKVSPLKMITIPKLELCACLFRSKINYCS
ncbi:hypothetical protein NQ314_017064 [Rhamnusium bicolor]|uniref:Uncharacterized protein n=1 Tax=Rhamnusium bicolor TaxID=1586634 RepID=A0AAV8WUX2_9CUCU|nr:hypothetical protein NQ314_017064 [Rhamnusium bicolor]